MGVASDQSYATPRSAPPASRKRKVQARTPTYGTSPATAGSLPPQSRSYIVISDDEDEQVSFTPRPKRAKRAMKTVDEGAQPEKRLRRFRPKAPQSFEDVYHRATTQRFYVLSRTRCGTAACPEEMVEMTGSTGNIYTVCIAQLPSCDCPHAKAGNQCKHIIHVMSRVLRAKYEYVYQLALLSSELQDIFANAPAPAPAPADDDANSVKSSHDKNRKPVDGDCPICFEEMEAGSGKESIVWCRAACGQNIHKECFEMWAATKRLGAGTAVAVTCPYCRSSWQGDDDMVRKIEKVGKLNREGYVNVADQLGISAERDFSTYSRWWSGHPNAYRPRSYR